ncbi:hypothetical protein IG631_22533 [Alternaria alternata]|nr:hypothetical protein IG631_22533 [Alternaria alternata]
MAGTAPHGASGFQVSTFDNNCAPCTSHVRRPQLAFGQRCKTIEREEQCFGLRVICQGDLKEIERERLCSYTSRHHIAHAVQTRTISQNSEAGRYTPMHLQFPLCTHGLFVTLHGASIILEDTCSKKA